MDRPGPAWQLMDWDQEQLDLSGIGIERRRQYQ